MGIWDWLLSDIPDQSTDEGYRQSSFTSTRIVCKPDENGKIKCTKYTTSRSSDPNQPFQGQPIQEDLPHDTVNIDPFKDLDDIMKHLLHSSRFGNVFKGPGNSSEPYEYSQRPDRSRTTPEFEINPPNSRWGRPYQQSKSEKGTDVYDI